MDFQLRPEFSAAWGNLELLYQQRAIKAMMNIASLGGEAAMNQLAHFKHISQGIDDLGGSAAQRRIQDMMVSCPHVQISY